MKTIKHGGIKMKKRFSFLSGALATLLVMSIAVPVLATGGKILYNQISVAVMDKTEIKFGDRYDAPNGEKVPSSITYTDAAGGLTNYLSVRQISELLNVDLHYDDEKSQVVLGREAPSDYQSPITLPDGTVIPGSGTAPTPIVPDLFSEVDPFMPEHNYRTLLQKMTISGKDSVMYSNDFQLKPADGNYISFVVTNNNTSDKEPLLFNISQLKTAGSPMLFPTEYVGSGETLIRTLEISPEANELTALVDFGVMAESFTYATDVTVEVVQFDTLPH